MAFTRIEPSKERVLFTAAAIAYVAAVCSLLPADAWPRTLLSALAVFGGLATAARLIPREKPQGFSILIAQFAAAAVLLVPTFPAMGGPGGRASLLAGGGVILAGAFWASLRFEGLLEQRKHHVSLGTALKAGGVFALGLSAMATIPLVIAFFSDARSAAKLSLVYPAYFAGGAGAALSYWLLQRVEHRPWGLYLIGVMAGFCLYAAVGPVVAIFDGEPIVLADIASIGFACGCLVGPPAAFSIRLSAD